MAKNKLSVVCVLLVLSLNSCQQKVTNNNFNQIIKPSDSKTQLNIEENKITFSQRRIIFYSKAKTLVPPEKNGGIGKYEDAYFLEVIGKNGVVEKTIDITKLNYKIGSNARLIDNRLIFSNISTYSENEQSYFSIFDINLLKEIKIPISKDYRELSWSNKNDKFTFIDKENNEKYLYISDLKGNINKLAKISTNDYSPDKSYSWSYDYKKIVFLQNNNKDINIINVDGSEQKTLLHNDSRGYSFPQLSYDNKFISYFHGTSEYLPAESFITKLDNLKEQRIGYGSDLVWLTDENKFLFSHHDGASHFLEYIDPNNLNDKVTLVSDITFMKLTQNKNEVFFNSYDGKGIINYKTHQKTILSKYSYLDTIYNVEISPDQKKIIILEYRPRIDILPTISEPILIVLFDLDKKKLIDILDEDINFNGGDLQKYNLKWSNDSKMIILDSGSNIYSVEEDKTISSADKLYIASFWLD